MSAFSRISILSLVMMGLVACQNSTQIVESYVDSYKILKNRDDSNDAMYLSCQAKQGCDFERVNDVLVIDEETKRPTMEAIDKGLVRLEGSVFSINHDYAVSLPAGDHEVAVRFYPVSLERAERFHLIHKFQAGHNYQLRMHRQRENTGQSLLSVATPGKLCVDLLQDQIALRRFCRDHNVMTGLGEFIEQDI